MKYILPLTALITMCISTNSLAEGFTGKRTSDLIAQGQRADTSKHAQIIREIEFYLSSFDTFEAQFVQTLTGRVQIRTGRIMIYRPGKVRWEYKTPLHTILVVNGSRLSYEDKELEQISYASAPETAISVLLQKDVKLTGGDLEIVALDDAEESVSVTVRTKMADNNFESLEMTFSKYPMQLHRIRRTNENNQATTLSLSNVVFNAPLSPDLFKLAVQKPRPKKN